MKKIKIDGIDWTELLQLKQIAGKKWPKEKPTDEELLACYSDHSRQEAIDAFRIKRYLMGFMCCDKDREKELKKVAKCVREFCLKMSKYEGDYSHSVYAGMTNIEHDEVLLNWVARNLECMWV